MSNIVTAVPGNTSRVFASIRFEQLESETLTGLYFSFAGYAQAVQSILVYDENGFVGTATAVNDSRSLFTLKFSAPLTLQAKEKKSFYFRAVIAPDAVASSVLYRVHGVFGILKDSKKEAYPMGVTVFSSLSIVSSLFSNIENIGVSKAPFMLRDATTIGSFKYTINWAKTSDTNIGFLTFFSVMPSSVSLQNVRVRMVGNDNQVLCTSNDWLLVCPMPSAFFEEKPSIITINLIADIRGKPSAMPQSLQVFAQKTRLSEQEMAIVAAAMKNATPFGSIEWLLAPGTLWTTANP